MISTAKDRNPKQTRLRQLLANPGTFKEAIWLCLDLHALVHESTVSGAGSRTYADELWDGLTEQTFRRFDEKKKVSIAWDVWHITRIEDLTVNLLVAGDAQVLNENRRKKMNSTVTDTGNAMTDREIMEFNARINMQELKNYRSAVGGKTREIVSRLRPEDLKRKMKPEQLARLVDESGVLDVPGSKWLLDFWGRKTVAGLLLMPVTRHQAVHLNDALRMKRLLERNPEKHYDGRLN